MLPLRSAAGPPPHDADDKDQKDVTKHSTQNYSDSREKFPLPQREKLVVLVGFRQYLAQGRAVLPGALTFS